MRIGCFGGGHKIGSFISFSKFVLQLRKHRKSFALQGFIKKNNISLLTIVELLFYSQQQIHEIDLSKVKSIRKMNLETEKIKLGSPKTSLVFCFYGNESDKKLCIKMEGGKAIIHFRKENNVGHAILWHGEKNCMTLFIQSFIGELVEAYNEVEAEKGKWRARIYILRELLDIIKFIILIIGVLSIVVLYMHNGLINIF